MRKTLLTAGLVLILSCPAFAGIIHTPAPTPPPSTTEAQGVIHNPSPDSEGSLLDLLESLLALL
jgi:hypothetical protein